MHPSRGSEYPDHRGMAKTEIPDQKNFDQFEAELTASSNEVEAGGDWAFDRGMYTITAVRLKVE